MSYEAGSTFPLLRASTFGTSAFFHFADLLDEVAVEGHVLAGPVRERHGNDVGQPLRLMDDGVGVGQILAVFHLDLTITDHLVQLLSDLLCGFTKTSRVSVTHFVTM